MDRSSTPVRQGELFPPDEVSAVLPGPPVSTVEHLRQQLEQLRLTVQEQEITISQLRGSSRASAPSPEQQQGSNAADRLMEAVAQSIRQVLPAPQQAGSELATRARTLANLLSNAPRYDGSTDVLLWKKRITDYLYRRRVVDGLTALDVLQEACEKTASDYLGALEEPLVTIEEFWAVMEQRFGKDEFSRMAEYEALRQRPTQTYRRYADLLTEKAYGLEIPRAAQLRKFLSTMLRSEELKRHLMANIHAYEDVRALAAAAEHLVADEVKRDMGGKCRICGKAGHFAASCPRKAAGARTSTRPVATAAAAEADDTHIPEPYAEEIEEFEELADYELEEQAYTLESTDPLVEAGEKRPANTEHEQLLKRLRGPGRPARTSNGAGPSGTLPQAPMAPSRTSPIQPLGLPQQPTRGTQEALRPVPLRSYRAPPPLGGQRPLVPPPRYASRPPAATKSLKKSVEGSIDVPAHILFGLILQASGQPERLARSWMSSAMKEARELLEGRQSADTAEADVEVVELGETSTPAMNPLTAAEMSARQVGYLPLRFASSTQMFWGLVDTGAQVSVISAGLAAYLDLFKPDLSNVKETTFTVAGYNGARSYMPVLETMLRLGNRGGEERVIPVNLCVLDSNAYKLLIGVDLLNQLRFVLDGPGRRIYLERNSIRFSLPLAPKDYAFNSAAVRGYHRALDEIPPTAEELEVAGIVELQELEGALESGQATQLENALSWVGRDYLGGQSLEEILYLAEMTVDETPLMSCKPTRTVATMTPALAAACLGAQTASAVGGQLLLECTMEEYQVAEIREQPQEGLPHLTLPGSSPPMLGEVTIAESSLVELPAEDSLAAMVGLAAQAARGDVTSVVEQTAVEESIPRAQDLHALPPAFEVSAAQFAPKVESILPPEPRAGDMTMASLPPRSPVPTLTPEQVASFLRRHSLTASGDPATLGIRAYKLQQAIETNPTLVDPVLPNVRKTELYQMLLDVAEVFATSLDDLRQPAKGEKFRIDTGTSPPIKRRAYKMARPAVEFLNKTILGQLEVGIVRPSRSAWSASAFVAYSRPYGTTGPPKERKVIDYRPVNQVTRSDVYPIPDVPELLEWLAGYAFFGAIDLKAGYWQTETATEDQCKTAFVIPSSFNEYVRVPFGLKNAPSFFQRTINELLQQNSVKHSRGFIDDLLTGGASWVEYLENQKKQFEVLLDNHWLVTVSKVRLGYTEIAALGHVVGRGYVKPDPEKVSALKRLQPPPNLPALRAFLGLAGYYRRFVPYFAKLSQPLTQLLAKEVDYTWGVPQQQAFELLKEQLSDTTLLHTVTPTGRFRLYTDYSSSALAAALHQVQDGFERPIAFTSRLCRGPEAHLSSAEGELCALVYALGKFRGYLGFTQFDVITDSGALLSLKSNQNLSSKLTRWSVLLSEFNFEIVHKPGAAHRNADGLSRCEQMDDLGAKSQLHVWMLSQSEDFLADGSVSCGGPGLGAADHQPAIQEINTLRTLEQGPCLMCQQAPAGRMMRCGRCGASQHATCCPNRPAPCYWYCQECKEAVTASGPTDITEDLELQQFLLGGACPNHVTDQEAQQIQASYIFRRGQLLVETAAGYRVYPTAYDRHQLVEQYHVYLTHMGWRGTLEALRDRYYWPSMEADVRRYCENCLACQLQSAVFRRAETLGGHLSATAPRTAWSMDCAPALATRDGQRASVLIVVDDFTRYVICTLMPRLDSAAVRDVFVERILTPYGRPARVRTDAGREFAGAFAALLNTLGIEKIQTRPVAPWTNGRAERMVRHVKGLMRRTLFANPQGSWMELIPWVTAAINATVSRSTGYSPHEVFFGEPPKPLIPFAADPPVPIRLGDEDAATVDEYVQQIRRRLHHLHTQVRATQQQYEQGLELDYEQYPVAGRQYAGDTQMARKAPFQEYLRGQLVMCKRPRTTHFSLGAAGPFLVLEQQGDSVLVQGPNGRQTWHNKANCMPLRTNVVQRG